jgi:predicted CXXCH cytochrome family protein
MASLALASSNVEPRPRGAPLPWGTPTGSVHAPYERGDCSACHDKKGPYPGPPELSGDPLCFSCHEEVQQHAHGFRHCLTCHNAHDSIRRRLLNSDLDHCENCHAKRGS